MKKGTKPGKRQLLLAVLVVALAAAVYLNWQFAGQGGDYSLTGEVTSDTSYLGEAQFVGNPSDPTVSQTVTGSAYFEQARQQRAAARQEGVQILKDVMASVKADQATIEQATAEAVQLAKDADTESVIENLVKAKGFADCVALIKEGQVSVVVPVADHLLASDTLQIQDIAAAQTGFSLENIKIVEVTG